MGRKRLRQRCAVHRHWWWCRGHLARWQVWGISLATAPGRLTFWYMRNTESKTTPRVKARLDCWGTESTQKRRTLNWRKAGAHPHWEKATTGLSRDAHLVPGVPEVVAVSVSHGDERLYGVNVLLLHLRDAGAGRQQGEACEGLDIGISFQLQGKQRGDAEIPTWVRWVSHQRGWALVPLLPPVCVQTGSAHINTPGPHQVLHASALPLPKYLIARLRTSLSSATDLPSEGAAAICWVLRLSGKCWFLQQSCRLVYYLKFANEEIKGDSGRR